jgi:Holliday junction resolvasome RuvABC endonuclease subunit
MIVGGFDIATTTGAAVLDGARVVHVEAFKASGETEAEIFRSYRRWFRKIIRDHGVKHVAIEQALVTNIKAKVLLPDGTPTGQTHNPVTMKTYLRLYGLRALTIVEASVLEVPLIEVNQMTWRKSFTGKARASKEETLALAQKIVPGLKSKDAAEAIGVAWHLNGVLRQEKLQTKTGDATWTLPI